MVRHAQQLGFSLREIGPLLKAYREKPPTKAETVAFLTERLRVVHEKIAALREVEKVIVDKLRHYDFHDCLPARAGKSGRAKRSAAPFGVAGRRPKARSQA
jgi:DNA-binding transcriptional MerR regulator